MNYNTHGPRGIYSERLAQSTKVLARQNRVTSVLSNLRIFSFLAGVGGFAYFIYQEELVASSIVFGLGFCLFVYLVIQHEAMKRKVLYTASLVQVNENALARLDGKWTEFLDDGAEYVDPDHPYSSDLDLFGHASVFQWVNATTTFFGRRTLQEFLTLPPEEVQVIHKRQEAVRELAGKLEWRQNFQVEGLLTPGGRRDPAHLLDWAERQEERLIPGWQIPLIFGLTAITVGWVIWALFIAPTLSPTALIPLVLQLGLFEFKRRKMERVFKDFLKFKHTVKVYENLLKRLGEESFESESMQTVKLALFDDSGKMAALQIQKLGKALDFVDIRNVPMYHVLFNILLLWDFYCLIALERWKANSGPALRGWLMALAEAEALASLATIHFDHPEWAMPQVESTEFKGNGTASRHGAGKKEPAHSRQHVAARGLGHPLLPEESRVCNDVSLDGAGTILLITGSNMSGKSTLLRTVGVNLVLAYAGAPVCADRMHCSLMQLYSSMRVNDNLEKQISSFYAELLRVKMIIEAARTGRPMLFLLDELFRGTNSRDRHTGAKTVLRNLSRTGVMGLVSTHDLELGELAEEKDLQIKNYHFTEHYQDGQICFDYKLRPGLSTTSNAIFLMKMIGIDSLE